MIRSLRFLLGLAVLAALLAQWSAASLAPDYSGSSHFGRWEFIAHLLASVFLMGSSLSPTPSKAFFPGLAIVSAFFALVLGALEPASTIPSTTPLWAQPILFVVLPLWLVVDWFWTPPVDRLQWSLGLGWSAVPLVWLGWAVALAAPSPYLQFDPSKAGGLEAPGQNAVVAGAALLVFSFLLVFLTRLRQGPESDYLAEAKKFEGLETRDRSNYRR